MMPPELDRLPAAPRTDGWPWVGEIPKRERGREPKPRVSIVTPSFQQGPYLEATIRSVFLQGYPNLEYIVIDGGSTDESIEILEKYDPWLTYWTSESDEGPADAIHKGFGKASGDILAWLNSDDVLLPGAVDLAVSVFNGRPEADVVFGDRIFIDAGGQPFDVYISPRKMTATAMRTGSCIPQETSFYRREMYAAAGGMNTDAGLAFDYDLFARMFRAGGTFVHAERFMGCFRMQSSSLTSRSGRQLRDDLLRARNSYFSDTVSRRLTNAFLDVAWSRFTWRLRKAAWLLQMRDATLESLSPEPSVDLGSPIERVGELDDALISLISTYRRTLSHV